MKPAVLYVAPEVPVPHEGTFLGGSTHVTEISRALMSEGFDVHVLCRRVSRNQTPSSVVDGIHVHRFYRGLLFPVDSGVSEKATGAPSMKSRMMKLAERTYFATLYRMAMTAFTIRIIQKHRIAVVLERNSAKGIGAFAAKISGVPCVEEVIDPDYSPAALRMAAKVFAYTPRVLRGLVPAERIVLTSAGVDTGLFRPVDGADVRRRLGLAGKKVAVYVGAASAWHGIDVLVQAVAYLGDEYRILIVGQASRRIREMAEVSGVSGKLVFTGFVPHEHVPEYISAADVAVAPYDPAGLKAMMEFGFYFSPIKIFEYMACAKPVVASDIDIVRDVVRDSNCGLLVPPADPVALAGAIDRLAASPQLMKEMGDAGRNACVDRYRWESVGGGIARELKSLTDAPLLARR